MRQAGTMLADRYRLDTRIGAGGMGEVWRATDQVLGRTVAIKLMLPGLLADADFGRRFRAEARAMASVHHPAVVPIHDYHSGPDGAFLIMAFIEGESLSQALSRLGRLSVERTMRIVAETADALQAVHDRGVVHRDVKPGNLLLDAADQVVLTDFGIARQPAATQLTPTGVSLGTPAYLAPEQVLGQPATPQSDVYALGVVAYECLTGQRPFEAESPYAVALMRLQEPPAPLGPEVPAPVRAVVERALAADPAQRWASAAELAGAARQLATGRAAAGQASGGTAPPEPSAAGPRRPQPGRQGRATSRRPGRSRWRIALPVGVAGVLLLLAAGAAVLAWNRDTAVPSGSGGGAAPSVGSGTPVPETTGVSAGDPGAAQPAGTTAIAAAAGLIACDDFYCPAEPTCWGGLVEIAGVPHPPRRIDCAEPHYWETFAALPMADLTGPVYTDEVADRADVAAACRPEVAEARSVDPIAIEGWIYEPWPVAVGDDWVVHCLANSGIGESTGSQFHP